MMNWKGCGRKRPRPNFGSIPAFSWKDWGKPLSSSVRIAAFRPRLELGTSRIRSRILNHSTTMFRVLFVVIIRCNWFHLPQYLHPSVHVATNNIHYSLWSISSSLPHSQEAFTSTYSILIDLVHRHTCSCGLVNMKHFLGRSRSLVSSKK
jgi:hypothetical protein